MFLSIQAMDQYIKKKIRFYQVLFYLSISIGLIIFLMNRYNVVWSIYFLFIATLSIPSISSYKTDLKNFHNNNFSIIEGNIVDLFPVKNNSSNWIIFLQTENKKTITEFTTLTEPELNMNNNVIIHHTVKNKIPFKIIVKD